MVRKPRAVLDVDGVVANFIGHLLTTIRAEITPEDVTVWDVFGLLSPAKRRTAVEVLACPDFWRTQPVLPLALEAVAEIERHYDVYWATSPWLDCSEWDHVRRAWLKTHFDAPSERVAVLSCKYLITADLFIDDRPSHVEDWKAWHPHTGLGLLFDAPYNRDSSLTRVAWANVIDGCLSFHD
jgi:5'(3')-deoxyribonucleotidase